MSLRPFYVEANIDGRQTNIGGGPRAKDGQMNVYLMMRDNGKKKTAYRISCFPTGEDMLCMQVIDSDGNVIHETITDY